jgi:hypothetical protein
MDEQKDFFIDELKDEITDYARLRIELFKVTSYEKIAKITAVVFTVLMITILVFFVSVFGSIMAGFYFSELTGSRISGFGIVAGFYLILLMVMVAFRKNIIEKLIINQMIDILFENDDDKKS